MKKFCHLQYPIISPFWKFVSLRLSRLAHCFPITLIQNQVLSIPYLILIFLFLFSYTQIFLSFFHLRSKYLHTMTQFDPIFWKYNSWSYIHYKKHLKCYFLDTKPLQFVLILESKSLQGMDNQVVLLFLTLYLIFQVHQERIALWIVLNPDTNFSEITLLSVYF